MNKLKIAFICEFLIILSVVIAVPFMLNNDFSLTEGIGYYIAAKVIIGLLLLASSGYAFFHSGPTGSNTVLVVTAALFQLIPMGIRYMLLALLPGADILSILITAATLLIYCGLFFGLAYMDKKMADRDIVSAGHEIPVTEEKVILNDEEEDK